MNDIESVDYVSQKKFKVVVTLGLKALANNIIRNEHSEKIHLSTRDGVQRYLDDVQPVVSAKVVDLVLKKDITNSFNIAYCRSRNNQPIRVSKYQ